MCDFSFPCPLLTKEGTEILFIKILPVPDTFPLPSLIVGIPDFNQE
jgi:hypothetical protein